MVDFLTIGTQTPKKDVTEVVPDFLVQKSQDLMIRGGDFYAIWLEDRGLWSTDEDDAFKLIDRELDRFAKEHADALPGVVKVLHMRRSRSGLADLWHKYCQRQMRDSFHMLDEKLIFANQTPVKEDYASHKLPYPLEQCDTPAWDKLMSTLYSEEERHKIEWAIGAIVTGDSVKIQKFLVLYGAAGTGKSTVLNIIQQLFEGYTATFDAKALGSANDAFALEAFKTNPLVAIQHDGDLSHIEDNTRLNSLVSHEIMTVNEKHKSLYSARFKSFLFMGTNKPVKITDAKSGLIRRLIDVSPTGNKIPLKEYNRLTEQVKFELGGIAWHCREVYLEDPQRYNNYIPLGMMGASNDFYNFMLDSWFTFKKEDGTSLKAAWEMYKNYCEEAKVPYPFSQRVFKEELKNYFREYMDRYQADDGTRIRSWYKGFRTEIFEKNDQPEEPKQELPWLVFLPMASLIDRIFADCPAQYATDGGTPAKKWENVKTKLSDLDTSKVHYVKIPENHIVIDFDIPNDDGNKCLERNYTEALKWPPTYAELSKSGQGIHLHYIYAGDPTALQRVYQDHVEIKVFTGNSSLRRCVTKCNSLPVATISSGLPMKGEKKMINFEDAASADRLRNTIRKALRKEIFPNTKPSVDFIKKVLDDAYESGMHYDVSNLQSAVIRFASESTHNASYCLGLVSKMHFQSEPIDISAGASSGELFIDPSTLTMYDVEVYPNLMLICWKHYGEDKPVVPIYNPTPKDIEDFMKMRLVGFNNLRYDNDIIYGRLIGDDNDRSYKLSQAIVAGKRNAGYRDSRDVSFTDVFDFSSKKQSLKKFEIELKIPHQELNFRWDEPILEKFWPKVAEYCANDVRATEAVFNARQADWIARQILANVAGMTVNDTTNNLTTRIVFGNERNPQRYFRWRNLAEPVYELPEDVLEFLKEACPEMMAEPHGEAKSLLPYFPGYLYEKGLSTYKGREVGEGGRVYAEPGIYFNVALLDIASMHPHSTIAECLFGVKFTRRFRELVESRVAIKHEDWEELNGYLDGKLTPYVQAIKDGIITSKDLANALKIAINAVYGQTAASYQNAFRDPNNIDNIVAKRGALFMVDLEDAVRAQGFTVAHIKTDSIKIPNATPEIIQFVMDFGKRYGYTFEHEATYERMCLVNDAVYIAKYADSGEWTATGTQFQVPYVFKTLFSHEPITFDDLCETKSVTSALYLKAADPDEPEFIGRVGLFCPIKPGCGGKELLRENRDKEGNVKYAAATGTKGYFWLEADEVKTLGKEDDIDRSYYTRLVDEAVEAIGKYGDVEQFLSGEPIEDTPPWDEADEPWNDDSQFRVR